MIGTALALGLGAATSAISGVANFAANADAQSRAQALQNKGLQEWLKANIPDPEQQKLVVQQFVQQGQINPKLEQAIKQDPSQFNQITTSASQKSAQNRALSELENMGYQGGLRLQDKAALQDAMMQGQVQDRANRQGILSDMSRRGMGGSGFELAAQLQGQSAGADRDARSSLSVAAQAQDRALQSIMGAGDLATKLRGQDYSEQAQRAAAQDAINRFNTSNLQDVQSRNIASQNRAAEMNLAEKQRVSDANTNLNNQTEKYNKELLQQQFDNQTKRAAGMTGQYDKMAQGAIQQGQSMGNMFTNIGQGVSGALSAAGNQSYWDNYFNKKNQGGGY
jgi:hypothetical protein